MIKLKRILMATDFSDYSKEALQYAVQFAKNFKAELHLIHIFENPYLSAAYEVRALVEEARVRDRNNLETLAAAIRKKGVKVKAQMMDGARYDRIIETARQLPADLIVMGTHGRTGLAHIVIGSVAERVLREAPCPVLTVRPKILPKTKGWPSSRPAG